MNNIDRARHALQEGTATQKATALLNISYWDEVPPDVVELIDKLREDRSIARMYAPFRYGELGYLATRVYALVRYRSGLREPVVMRQTVLPLKGEHIMRICENNNIELDSDDPTVWFLELKKRGLVTVEDVTFDERSFDLEE